MQLPASFMRRRRALGRAPATPTSNPSAGSRGGRGPAWLAGLALAALSVAALSGASAQASTDKLAERLQRLDPGALVGGDSIVGTRPGRHVHGVPGRPNFIAALGDGETIHGAAIGDQLGAGPHAEDVRIIAPAKGHSLIVGGPGSRIVVSGKGHNLIYSHAAGATIVLNSPGNKVIADGPHDRIVCAAHASYELIEVARGVKVSKSCQGDHNEIEPVPSFRIAPSSTLSGSGTNTDPYIAPCDAAGSPECKVTFPWRTLTGLWAHEYVPAYRCPSTNPYLVFRDYAPAGTRLPMGVEVLGLGPIGVSISGVMDDGFNFGYAVGTLTGGAGTEFASSATNWTTGSASYAVVLHCTSSEADSYRVH